MIRVEDAGGVRTITLDRGEKRNAMTPAMLGKVAEAFEASGAVNAVMLCGAGRVFCAGFDLDMCRANGADQPALRALLVGLSRAMNAARACPVPIVVAAHGAAIAGGCALVCACDVMVADSGAKLGYPVARLGVSPAVSGPSLLGRLPGGHARTRLLDCGLIDGRRAFEIGLVHELVDERDGVIDRATSIARAIAGKPPGGVRRTKAWLNELSPFTELDVQAGLDASLALVGTDESNTLMRRTT